jgi:hypothetical protein
MYLVFMLPIWYFAWTHARQRTWREAKAAGATGARLSPKLRFWGYQLVVLAALIVAGELI